MFARRSPHPTLPLPWQAPSAGPGARTKAALCFAAVLTVVLVALVLRVAQGSRRAAEASLGERPPLHVAVLVDATTPFTDAERRRLAASVLDRERSLPVGARLSVVAIAPEERTGLAVTRPLFSACRPRDGSVADPFIENGRLLKKRSLEGFEEPLRAALEEVGRIPASPTSPILAALYETATMPSFRAANRRVLVVASDLMENALISHYRPPYSFAQVRDAAVVAGAGEALAGAEVVVLRRHSRGSQQTPAHRRFWEEYMKAVGVASFELRTL